MIALPYQNGTYETAPTVKGLHTLVGLRFYLDIATLIGNASTLARLGWYDDEAFRLSGLKTIQFCESVGMKVHITGADVVEKVAGPCVFVANHMSVLETFALPVIIGPSKLLSIIVKDSLVDYPVFGPVMRSRYPIVVHRKNPREDLAAVLAKGPEMAASGRSIVVFPQHTRSVVFDPKKFNTLGIKLALRAKVPVIPIALKTNAWGNGRYFRDAGRIDPSLPVHFAFGPVLEVTGKGDREHKEIVSFIRGKLKEWGGEVNEDT